jgi:phosphoglucosamine mutase
MSRALFGTDGLRGLAGEYPLNEAGAEQIGRAIGMHFAKPGQTIIIAHDPRESSEGLAAAVTSGLTAVGVNVISAGVIPTPGLAYLTREGQEFVAGVMITASHNTYEYNGVKVFDKNGDKLTDEVEADLNHLIDSNIQPRGTGKATEDNGLIRSYEDFLVGSAGSLDLKGLRVAVDSANGAASGLAERIFTRLGAQVKPLFDSPDGRNINVNCGATDTKALSEEVLSGQFDLGIALDGDADRLALVDDHGREVNGDHLMYMLAVASQLKGLVATVMSNFGLEKALEKHGITLKRVAVGDRYVLEGLRETGFRLGGEQSGHIIFPDLLATGDGLLAAVQVVRTLSNSAKNLAQWRDEVELSPQALINIKLPDKALLDRSDIRAFIDVQASRLAGKGRVLVRPSGTEPLARVMVEAPDASRVAKQVADELQVLISKTSGGETHG